MLLLLACTSAAPDDSATPDPEPLPDRILHLSGESQYYDAGGTARGAPTAELLKRTVAPTSATLVERVLEDGRGGVEEYTVNGVIDPEGPTWTFAFTTGGDTIEGSGTFDAGETWDWTAWHSTSTFQDGDYAGWTTLSEDRLEGDTFTAHKSFTDADGADQGYVEETLTVVDPETWETTAAEW